MNKKFLLFSVVALAAGAVYWQHSHKAVPVSEAGGGRRMPALVSVAPVTRKDVPVELSAVGAVVPYQSVTVRSRLDSQIIDVKFHPGDFVNAGDLLFVLDDRSIKAQIEEQQSNLARDQAQDKNLQLLYERKRKLSSQGYETQENLDAAKSAYEAQHATVAATAAALENLKVQLQYTQITAPISGRTGTVSLTAGNNVKANDTTPLTTINQVKPIWAQISLPQRYIDAVRQAKAAGEVTATAQHEKGKLVSGRLDYIDNAVDTATGTFAVRALFANDDEQLWPGMFVTVTLQVGAKKDVLTVPEVAIQHSSSGDFVYTVAGGKAHRRTVTVELIQNGEAVVAEGLKPGENVVTDGMIKLEDGSEVKTAADEKS